MKKLLLFLLLFQFSINFSGEFDPSVDPEPITEPGNGEPREQPYKPPDGEPVNGERSGSDDVVTENDLEDRIENIDQWNYDQIGKTKEEYIKEYREQLKSKKDMLLDLVLKVKEQAENNTNPLVKFVKKLFGMDISKDATQIGHSAERVQKIYDLLQKPDVQSKIASPRDIKYLENEVGMEKIKNLRTLKSDDIASKLDELHTRQKEYLQNVKGNFSSFKGLTKDDLNFVEYLSSLPEDYRPPLETGTAGTAHQGKRPGIEDVIKFTKSGEELIPKIKNGTITKDQSSIEGIRDLQWAFYKKALVDGDWAGFTSGMVRIKDPDGKLFDFMNSKDAYTRKSSHYNGIKNNSLGLDTPEGFLPNGRSTIHFGDIGEGQDKDLFVKWEWHGMNKVSDIVDHALDFFRTRGLQDLGAKEHLPTAIRKQFEITIEKMGLKLTPDQKTELKNNGIKFIERYLKNPRSQAPEEMQLSDTQSFIEFVSLADSMGLWSDAPLRKGNEKVINFDKFKNNNNTTTPKKRVIFNDSSGKGWNL